MFLTIDAETSDLYKRDLAAADPAQPWIVTLAAELSDDDGATRDFLYTRIKADGRQVRKEAEAVHGISSRAAGRAGVSETAALGVLVGFAAQASRLVGFNVEFDRDVVASVITKLGKDPRMVVRPGLELVDVMKSSVPFCRIPSGREDGQHKWPTLDEACALLLGEEPRRGSHDAWADLGRTKRLYLALLERGAFERAA